MEVLIHNFKELEKINPEKEAVKIASTVGKKKRQEIVKKAEELKVKVLNPQLK
jgi:large subunit ribosomal protein L32e